MTRKDWFYAPLPIAMARALDEMIEEKAKKYGLDDRSELIRLVVGRFIMQYDENNDEVRKLLEDLVNKILYQGSKKKVKILTI